MNTRETNNYQNNNIHSNNKKDEPVEHIGITCDITGMSPIVGNRYKFIAHNYDLCEEEYNKLDKEEQKFYIKISEYNRYDRKPGLDLRTIYKELRLRWDVREATKFLDLDKDIPKEIVHKKLIAYYLIHPEERLSTLQSSLLKNREEIFNEIGKETGIPMWNSLSETERKKIENSDRDAAATDYYDCVPTLWNGIKLLNFIPHDQYRSGYTRGMQAQYTLNLNTLNPTKNSPIQKKISKDLCNKLELIRDKLYLY